MAVALCLFCVVSACASPPTSAPSVEVSFRGLWFTVDERLRIDAGERLVSPTRDLALQSWNAMYATANAHPEIVNVLVRISSPPAAARQAVVLVLRQDWQTRTGSDDFLGRWGQRSSRTSPLIDLVPGRTIDMVLPLAAGETIRRLTAPQQRPVRLAVRVDLCDADRRRSLAMTRSVLPIVVQSREPELERQLTGWQPPPDDAYLPR